MPSRIWTSQEARRIYSQLQMELLEAEGENARLLRARCQWLEEEFSNSERRPEILPETRNRRAVLAG